VSGSETGDVSRYREDPAALPPTAFRLVRWPGPHGAAHVERHFLSLKAIDLDLRPSAATPPTGSALKSRFGGLAAYPRLAGTPRPGPARPHRRSPTSPVSGNAGSAGLPRELAVDRASAPGRPRFHSFGDDVHVNRAGAFDDAGDDGTCPRLRGPTRRRRTGRPSVLRWRPAGWAVDYARGLGFESAAEFGKAAAHLGQWSGPSDVVFGYHGEPFFREGPFDNSARVMRTLEQSVGRDNFTFFVTA